MTDPFFPVRCMTCNRVLGRVGTYELYEKLTKKFDGNTFKALDHMEMKRECCRRMFLGFVPDVGMPQYDRDDKLNSAGEVRYLLNPST